MKKLILLLVLVTISCNELDTRLSTSLDSESGIKNVETLEGVVNGVYSRFQSQYLYNRNILVIPAVMSDNGFIDGTNNTGRFLDFDSYEVTSTNAYNSPIWLSLGRVISQSSLAIRKGEALSVTNSKKDKKNQLVGEMYATRALAYYIMQQFYSQPYNYTSDASHLGSPIPDFSILGGKEILYPSRSTTKQSYDQILKDLSSAESLMKKNSSKYRFGIDAVNSLFARVYINMEKWDKAVEYANKVIPKYSLINNADYLSSWDKQTTSETILSIANTEVDNAGVNSIAHFNLDYYDLFASPNLVSTFSDTDVRKDLYPTYNNKGTTVNIVKKYPEPAARDINIPVFRLSELYLIKAEALANLNRYDEALEVVYKIIKRADDKASKPVLTGQKLKDLILLERRKELAFEGFRLFDLTRNKIDFNKYKQEASETISVKSPNEKTIMPIPFLEISANKNMKQNPSY